MDRSDVVRRAAQKVVRMGYVVCNHRVAQGSYLGASFDKSKAEETVFGCHAQEEKLAPLYFERGERHHNSWYPPRELRLELI